MGSAPDLRLFLDLGDLFTKALAVRGGSERRVRFPSVVAHALLDDAPTADRLLLYAEKPVPRPAGFDAAGHERLRSYPGKREALTVAKERGHPAQGARFAGKMAVLYGADRRTLGEHVDDEVIDALVHKALLKTASGCREVEVVYVVDEGPKAAAIERYAEAPREIEMLRWTFDREEPEHMQLAVRGRVVDAASCVEAALPEDVHPASSGRTLVVDVGHLSTLLAVLTPRGCARQVREPDLGYSDCVRRVLRDGQELGLVEDELAVIWALERGSGVVTVADRRFDVRAMLSRAAADLLDELARAARRLLVADFNRHAEPCRVVALTGGGAAGLGEVFEARLRELDLGLETFWRPSDASYLLVEGARALSSGA